MATGKLGDKIAAADMSCLMHAAVAEPSVARQLVLDGVKAPDGAVARVRQALEFLQSHCKGLFCVFDGQSRPEKQAEEAARRAGRQAAAEEAKKAFAANDAGALRTALRKALPIPPELKRACVYEANKLGLRCIMAPYEADGQLVDLYRRGKIDAALTNDGDILALGCPVLRLEPSRPFLFMQGALRIYDPRLAPSCVPAGIAAPAGPDIVWLLARYGQDETSAVLVSISWAILCGCDFNRRSGNAKGLLGVGPSTAYAVLQHCGKQHGQAVNWTSQRLLCSLKQAQYRGRDNVVAALTSDAVERFEAVRAAFLEQPVLQDVLEASETGKIGPLCGGSYAQLPNSSWASVTLPPSELALEWGRGESDPAAPSVAYALPGKAVPPAPLSDADVGTDLYGDANKNLVEQLKEFLKSRNLPVSGSDGSGAGGNFVKADLVALVKLIREQDAKYGIMHVRDPKNGISTGHVLLKAGAAPASLPQFDESLKPPDIADAIWSKSMAGVMEGAPLIDNDVIKRWARAEKMLYMHRGREEKGESFRRGEQRCANNPYPEIRCTMPYDDHLGRKVVWVRDQVPRSTTHEGRRDCCVCFEVDTSKQLAPAASGVRTPPVALRVLRATCPCTKGKGGCAHKSCVLHTVLNLPRDERLQWRLPSTSKECNWNRPAESRRTYDPHRPIEYMPGYKADRNIEARPNSERRLSSIHGVKGSTRADFKPRPAHVARAIRFTHGD